MPGARSSRTVGARAAPSSPPDRRLCGLRVLSAPNRMHHRGEFTAAVRGGRRAGRPSLAGHLARTGSPDPARVGLVVSRAVGPSVVRNLVKRRLRHLLRERVALLPEGALFVVRANPAASSRSSAELARDLDGVLGRLLREPVS